MPSVTIREIDSTIYSTSSNNIQTNNIVFVPGPAITGPGNTPTLVKSYNDFIQTFGTRAPSSKSLTGTAWDIAVNLLQRDFAILYYRVVPESDVKQAEAELNGIHVDSGLGGQESEVKIGTIKEIYGGTGGNDLSYRIVKTSTAVYFRTYVTETKRQIESVHLFNLKSSDEENKNAFIQAVGKKLTTRYVEISITNPESVGSTFEKLKFDDISTYHKLSGGTDAADSEIAKEIPNVYPKIADRYLYDYKFLTSGGYTEAAGVSNGINESMLNLAKQRGNCAAFIDIPFGTPKENAHAYVNGYYNTSYGSAYAPWQYMKLGNNTNKWMPPSFIFLYTLAKSIKSGNKIWNPPAGVNRATVPEIIEPEYEIDTELLNTWQNETNVCINPIMRLRQYGYVIYGQRTLYQVVAGDSDTHSVLQELGVRLTVNEIKKLIEDVAITLTFERNNLHTWNEFKGRVEPKLSQMKSDDGITDYHIIMDASTTVPSDVSETKIKGIVKISIARAAEDFDIGFELHDSSVTFTAEKEGE